MISTTTSATSAKAGRYLWTAAWVCRKSEKLTSRRWQTMLNFTLLLILPFLVFAHYSNGTDGSALWSSGSPSRTLCEPGNNLEVNPADWLGSVTYFSTDQPINAGTEFGIRTSLCQCVLCTVRPMALGR
ncbi:hypothetical protein BKA82DRAFT_519710 [Pisolithus tinctorius]|uniref:Uncharacterized protein n=1 Tax=Pisolithus tinctorius Marx 270 TaxID=870435 RepID=A0A0C3NWR0_PISTI|nr:hypothetical protein BKA82DRAFT_519710 [Pisolithus tinctorius]KIO05290.1 hypothetical protein M404DRAFT_519710 [Pisolithus tinctorius Marx 270]